MKTLLVPLVILPATWTMLTVSVKVDDSIPKLWTSWGFESTLASLLQDICEASHANTNRDRSPALCGLFEYRLLHSSTVSV
jgi:hypothetical protein